VERIRYFNRGLKGNNQLVLGFLGAFTRIEQLVFGEKERPDIKEWKERTSGRFGDGVRDLYWQNHFEWEPKVNRIKDPGASNKNNPITLKSSAKMYGLWGDFLRDYLDLKIAVHPKKAKQRSLFEKYVNSFAYPKDKSGNRAKLNGKDFFDHLRKECGDTNPHHYICKLFPDLEGEFLKNTPGVELLSPGSLEMALYDYANINPKGKLGVFLVTREARPGETESNNIGLIRDLIYIHQQPSKPNPNATVGCYVSVVDKEIYPVTFHDEGKWVRLRTKPNDVSKSLEIYFSRPENWREIDHTPEGAEKTYKHTVSVGLLHGITKTKRSPGTWKTLITQPAEWGQNLVEVEAMLDLCGAGEPNLIDPEIQSEILLQLGRRRRGVIGVFPMNGTDTSTQYYNSTRLLFAESVSFLSVSSRRSRIQKALGHGGIKPETGLGKISYEKLVSLLVNNWSNLASPQIILNLKGQGPMLKFNDEEFERLFGVRRLFNKDMSMGR